MVVDEEGGIRLRLDEAQARDMADKTIEPRPQCLTEAVERAREEADVVGSCVVDEAGRLLTVDPFLKIAVQKGVGDVKLVRRPVLASDECEHRTDRGWFDYR